MGFNTVLMAGCDDKIYAKFVTFAGKLISKCAARVGWEKKDTDGHLDGMMRETMISLMAKFSHEDPAVVAEARKRYNAYIGGDKSVLPDDIKVPAFVLVIKTG